MSSKAWLILPPSSRDPGGTNTILIRQLLFRLHSGICTELQVNTVPPLELVHVPSISWIWLLEVEVPSAICKLKDGCAPNASRFNPENRRSVLRAENNLRGCWSERRRGNLLVSERDSDCSDCVSPPSFDTLTCKFYCRNLDVTLPSWHLISVSDTNSAT